MVVPFTIQSDAFKGLEPNSQQYKLWLSFLGIARKGGILVGDSAQINDLILSAGDSSPLARNLQVLRKRKFKENEWSFANNVLEPLEVLNIEDFFVKKVNRFFERSLPFCCSFEPNETNANEDTIKTFLAPLLCLSFEVHIYDKFLADNVKGNSDLQFYTFTIQKIISWLCDYNALIESGKDMDFNIYTDQIYDKESFETNFKEPIKSKFKNVHLKVHPNPRSKQRCENKKKAVRFPRKIPRRVPLDRYIFGSIPPSNGGRRSDEVLCAKISHGFNFFKVSSDKMNKRGETACYDFNFEGRTFSERYTFPRDFYTTPDSFHSVSYDDFTKINSIFSR